eukprot:TRINITY_DN42201_c0_g1_i1.p1 TRINITY_DN42201_c0_g1~~TRINITY_DN42201_c0_g1_i1.p1  ORF type:complete len:441 (+),score=83.39 TRINITY_DN42201_c0_g1_i1:49-1323(+)
MSIATGEWATPLKGHETFSASLFWEKGCPIDVDLQAVIVDKQGRIVDAAYYNNMKACGKAVVHTGDQGGHSSSSTAKPCETVRVNLSLLPPSIHMVFFLACCFNGGELKDVAGAECSFCTEKPHHQAFGLIKLSPSTSSLLICCLTKLKDGEWRLRWPKEELPEARHFMDCLPALNARIVAEIPTANRRQKVAFAMEKGDVLDFGASMQKIILGLGWDNDRGEVDLDASAVLFGANGDMLESIFFGNLRSCGSHSVAGAVAHSGDNLTGEGDGDDEQISVNLNALGEMVKDVFFSIHIYSKGRDGRPKTFRDVANAYCRVVDDDNCGHGEELCRYTLRDAADRSGVIIARLRRSMDGRFGFHALGVPSTGTMYKDAIPDMQRLAATEAWELQLQRSSSATSDRTGHSESTSATAEEVRLAGFAS